MSRTHVSIGALVIVAAILLVSNPSAFVRSLSRVSSGTQTAAVAPIPYSNNFEFSALPLRGNSASIARYYNPYRARSGAYVGKVRISGTQGGVFVRFSVPGNLTPGASYTLSSYLSESNKKEEFGRLSVAASINGGALIQGNDTSSSPWSSWAKSEVNFTAPQYGYVDAYVGYGDEKGGEFYRGELWIDDVLIVPTVVSGPQLEARIQPYLTTQVLPVDTLGLALGQVMLNAVGSTQAVEVNSLTFKVDTQASSYPSSFSNFGLYDGVRLVSIGFLPQSLIPGATSVLSFYFPNPVTLQPGVNKTLSLRGDSGFIWPAQGAYTLNLTNASASLGAAKSAVSVSTSGSVGGALTNSSTGSNSAAGPTGNNCFEPLAPPSGCSWDQGKVLPSSSGGKLYFRNWRISYSPGNNYAPKCENAGGSDSHLGTQSLVRGYAGCHCKLTNAQTSFDPDGGYSTTYREEPTLKYPDKSGCCLNTATNGDSSGLPYNPQEQICCPQTKTSAAHLRPRCTKANGDPQYKPGDVCTPAAGLPAGVTVQVAGNNTDGCCPITDPIGPPIQNFLNALPPGCSARITAGASGCHEDDSRHYTGCAVDIVTSSPNSCGLLLNPARTYSTGRCTPIPGVSDGYHCQLCPDRP